MDRGRTIRLVPFYQVKVIALGGDSGLDDLEMTTVIHRVPRVGEVFYIEIRDAPIVVAAVARGASVDANFEARITGTRPKP